MAKCLATRFFCNFQKVMIGADKYDLIFKLKIGNCSIIKAKMSHSSS